MKLSPRQIVACSPYSEGCKGGEGITVGWFGQDYEYIPETCFPYDSTPGKCKYKCRGKKPRIG